MTSPCEDCRHIFSEEITDGLYGDDCMEGAPEGVFMSEWGCWRYESRPPEPDGPEYDKYKDDI